VARGIPAALARAASEGVFPQVGLAALAASGDSWSPEADILRKPVGLFYDLDAWEANLRECQAAFGPGFLHTSAMKSNGLIPMLSRARELGFGTECASIGEVMHAERLGFSGDRIIYDSPVKTAAEIRYALEKGLHINADNFEELEVVAECRKLVPNTTSTVGLRINPLVGSGEIAALSVSIPDSKFGVPIRRREDIVAAYKRHDWITCVHVHSGSSMTAALLAAGIRNVTDLALDINASLGRHQVSVLDMGGGLVANYRSEAWHTDRAASFAEYARELRATAPLAFPETSGSPFRRVVTEFGQSLHAKSGWLASRIEYTKPLSSGDGQIATIHFGADVCLRQCYTKDHNRRLEFYDGETYGAMRPTDERPMVPVHVGGPLCFEGDIITRDAEAPRLRRGDIVVLREAGANTLSLYSRHCLRQVPAAYGYRLRQGSEAGGVSEWVVLKPSEDLEGCSRHWGWAAE